MPNAELFRAHFLGNGAGLYLRDDPPAGNTLEYGDDEPGEFLGRVVLGIGVPRWMSSHFADVVAEQDQQGTSLDLYPQDWMEKVIFIPADDDMQEIAGDVVRVSDAVQHGVSSGCQRISPRTTIQAVGSTVREPDPNSYYAIVSKSGINVVDVLEITITQLENRPKFTASFMHKTRLAECATLRAENPDLPGILKIRSAVLAAITGLPTSFAP